MPAAKDYTGMRYGRLLTLQYAGVRQGRRSYLCACECGNQSVVPAHRLVSGQTTSCGCRKREVAAQNCRLNHIPPTHGMSKTPTFSAWSSMIERSKANYSRAENYAGRGITVCDRWLKFENFFADMGLRPTGKTIDRIDVNGNYEPTNCRWATNKEQQRNRRNTRYLVINGARRPLMDVADELGIKKPAAQYFFSTFKALLLKYGDVSIAES